MPGESITFLYEFAMEHEIGIVTYEDENIITETPENEYVLEEQKINKRTIKKVDSFCDYVKFPVTKCLMVGDGDILENIETKLKEEVGQMLSIYRSAPYFLEIMPLNITKDGALSWLSAYSAKTEHSLRMSGALFRQERIIALLVNKVTCFLHVYRDLESLIDML